MVTQINSTLQRTSRLSLRTKIRRIISDTINDFNQSRFFAVSYSAYLTMFLCMLIANTVHRCHQSLEDQMPISNTTSSKVSFECDIFNEQCLCRMSSNGTQVPRHCIGRLQFHLMRMLPSLSFVLLFFALQEFFTYGVECNRVFARIGRLVSSFVCGAVTTAMFCSHCHHRGIILSIFAISVIMALLTTYDCERRQTAAEN